MDAPVSGGDKGAKGASLAIMAGGGEAVVHALAPLFGCMGKTTYMGPPGAGQSCKMANQVRAWGMLWRMWELKEKGVGSALLANW